MVSRLRLSMITTSTVGRAIIRLAGILRLRG